MSLETDTFHKKMNYLYERKTNSLSIYPHQKISQFIYNNNKSSEPIHNPYPKKPDHPFHQTWNIKNYWRHHQAKLTLISWGYLHPSTVSPPAERGSGGGGLLSSRAVAYITPRKADVQPRLECCLARTLLSCVYNWGRFLASVWEFAKMFCLGTCLVRAWHDGFAH